MARKRTDAEGQEPEGVAETEAPTDEAAAAEPGPDVPSTDAVAEPAGEEPPPAEDAPATVEAEADNVEPEPEPEPEPDAAEAAVEAGDAEAEAEADGGEAKGDGSATSAAAPAKPARTRRQRKESSAARAATKASRAAAAKTGARKPIVRLPKPEHDRGRTRERVGVVVSAAMDKTIVVKVETSAPHPRYKKVVRHSRKFHAHDAENTANVGDVVRIVETRPLSRLKRWRLAEVVQAAR